MRITLLGSGTSQGVPIIGCRCRTCTSEDQKDKRLRASVFVEVQGLKILIDTSIDFRQQFLANKLTDVDVILFTHHHVDHIFGMDDLRQINQRLDKWINIYGNNTTLEELKITFRYILDKELIRYKAVPLVTFNEITNKEFYIKDILITPIEVLHGRLKIFGYRIGKFAYITDCSRIPEEEYVKLEGLDVLILNALRKAPHPTHFNLKQATEVAEKVRPKMTYLTHITHDMHHEETNSYLPEEIRLGFDGLEININD